MLRIIIYLYVLLWPILGELTIYDMGDGLPALDFYRPVPLMLAASVFINKLALRKHIKTDIVIWFTLIFVVYFIINIGINGVRTNYFHGLREILRRYLVPLSLYFSLINLSPEIDRKILVRMLLLSGIYIACVGIAEFAIGRNLIGPIGFVGNEKFYRTNGPFWDVIGYAGIVLSFLPLSYYSFKENLIGTPFSIFCVLIFSASCLLNYSRVIWLTFALIAITLVMGNNLKTIFISFYLVVLSVIALYFSVLALQGTELFQSRITDPRNIIQRYDQFIDAISLFWLRPILGSGFLSYMKTHAIQLHNSYLLILVEFGLAGALCFALHLFSLLFIRFRQTVAAQGIQAVKMRLSLVIIALIVPNTIDFLGNAYFILIMFIITAIIQMRLPEHSLSKNDSI